MTNQPEDAILESLCRLLVNTSEKLKYLVALSTQDTVQMNDPSRYSRPTQMVQRYLEQRISESHSKARNKLDEQNVPCATGKKPKGMAKIGIPLYQ